MPLGVQAQSALSFDEVGRLYVQNFGPKDYDAHAQNWAIVQTPDGLLYVGNGDGVLEYDGVSWRLIPVSNQSAVRSLAIDVEGRVFVGAMGELGYLAPDALGRMRYVSLLDHILPTSGSSPTSAASKRPLTVSGFGPTRGCCDGTAGI